VKHKFWKIKQYISPLKSWKNTIFKGRLTNPPPIIIIIIIIIMIYYILYTIYYILYTIYYILYTIYYILFTSYCLHHFLSKYTQIWAILRKSWGCSSSVQDVVDTFFQMKMVQDLPETISSSKTKRFKSYEIFTHWPPANTVTNLPQIGFFSKSGFSR